MISKSNYNNISSEFDSSTVGDYQGKHTLNKFDYELYDEEQNLVETVFRVKRTSLPNKGEKWRVISDNKVVFIVDGAKISKKEKEFLRTSEGFNFLIAQAKIGIKSLNKLRIELKKKFKK